AIRRSSQQHDPGECRGAGLVFEASRSGAVAANAEMAIRGGVRRFVIGTTGWDASRDSVEALLRRGGVAAIFAPNLSIGAALFLRLVDRAGELFASMGAFDPYILEWHRREKRDQ